MVDFTSYLTPSLKKAWIAVGQDPIKISRLLEKTRKQLKKVGSEIGFPQLADRVFSIINPLTDDQKTELLRLYKTKGGTSLVKTLLRKPLPGCSTENSVKLATMKGTLLSMLVALSVLFSTGCNKPEWETKTNFKREIVLTQKGTTFWDCWDASEGRVCRLKKEEGDSRAPEYKGKTCKPIPGKSPKTILCK